MSYTLITTADGSTSYINNACDEAYHSIHGAYSEALEKHVLACRIPELAASQYELNILDICFGLGYNSGVAIEQITKINPDCKINIVGLENDAGVIELIASLAVPESYRLAHATLVGSMGMRAGVILSEAKDPSGGAQGIATAASLPRDDSKNATDVTFLRSQPRVQNTNLQLLLGDARKTIEQLELNHFDAIFFDPFSPRKCPELWQADFIAAVVARAKPGAYISTYSSARIAKDGFKAAGCSIEEGPRLGRRSGGVLARRLC